MISSVHWVRKGVFKAIPDKFVPSHDELKAIHATDAAAEEDPTQDSTMNTNLIDGLPASFRMDQYDEDCDVGNMSDDGGMTDEEGLLDEMNDMELDDQDDDEAMAAQEFGDEEPLEEDPDDMDDLEIRPTDSVILVAHTEEDFSTLEVQVYDAEEGALYVHHELALPAFPLALAWMNCCPDASAATTHGSFVAVGTFKCGIEIWNLDVLDVLEPAATLGGECDDQLRSVAVPDEHTDTTPLKPDSHADAVMCLDWNPQRRNMLLSGSADGMVKLWDLTTQRCMSTMAHHTGSKVACVKWHLTEATIVASAALGGQLCVFDARASDVRRRTFDLASDPEALAWDPHHPHLLMVGEEAGYISSFDVRTSGAPLYRFHAHGAAVSGVAFSPTLSGCFVSASEDESVKVWDLEAIMANIVSMSPSSTLPSCIASKDMAVGQLFTLSFAPDCPTTLVTGGSSGILALWDIAENTNVDTTFAARAGVVSETTTTTTSTTSTTSTSSATIEASLQLLEEEGQEMMTKDASSGVVSARKSKKKKKKVQR